jgi:glycosyltransferase involved in cell wall biosynthesis
MSHSRLLSVVLPVYKTEDQLARCLSSVLEQDLAPADYEVIVVDDGSPDGSVEVARGFEERYPNVVIVLQADRGSRRRAMLVLTSLAANTYGSSTLTTTSLRR